MRPLSSITTAIARDHLSQPWQDVALLRFQDSQALHCISSRPLHSGGRPQPASFIALPVPRGPCLRLPQGCAYTLRLSGARKSLAESGRWTRRPATCTWRTLSKAASLRSHTAPRHAPATNCRSLDTMSTHSFSYTSKLLHAARDVQIKHGLDLLRLARRSASC